jgi:hypothetical protein
MSHGSDRPFGHATLKIRGVFVPETGKASASEIARSVGHDAARVGAVLVPEGGKPPGYPFVRLGMGRFRLGGDDAAGGEQSGSQGSGGGGEPGQQDYPGQQQDYPGQQHGYPGQQRDYSGQQQEYPGQQQDYSGQQHDYSGQQQESAPLPPVPALVREQANPERAGLGIWRSIGSPGALRQTLAAQRAISGTKRAPPTASNPPPDERQSD